MTETKEKTKGKIFAQMAKILKETSAIGKEKKAGGLAYAFRGIDDVYNELHSIFAKHSVFTIPTVLEERSEERKTKTGGVLIYRILKIAYRFFADDGSFVSAIVVGEGMDSGDKAANKAMAVGHKYLLLQSFCIPTEDVKDPEENHHEVTEKTKPAAKEKAKPTNGKEKGAQKPPAAQAPPAATEEPPPIEKAGESDFMPNAKPPSKFDTAVLMTVKGEKKRISYKEALEHFKTAKKFLGNKDYYQVLGDIGYEKSSELPFEKLDEVYKLMLKKYNDRKDFS